MSLFLQHSHHARITRNVIALGLVSLFTDAATEMIYPLVPVFLISLGSGVFLLGVIEGIAETTAAMLKLVSGTLSDKSGKRKPLVVIGYAISTIIRPLTGAVSAAWQIVFIRMIDRTGKGIRTAPRDALIASSVDDRIRGKAYGFHRAMDHTGAVVGPFLSLSALAILILCFHVQNPLTALRHTFLFAAIPGFLALLTLIFLVREKPVPDSTDRKTPFSWKQFDKNFMNYLWIITLFTLGNSSDAFLLYRIQGAFHQNGTITSMISNTPVIGDIISRFADPAAQQRLQEILLVLLAWAFFHIIKAVFSTRLGSLSDKAGRKTVIRIGWCIYTFVYVAFAMLDRFPYNNQIIITFALFALYALYYAFCEGAEKAFVADLVPSEKRGSAFGMFHFATGLAALPASVIFGLLYKNIGPAAAFGTGAMIAFVSLLLFTILVTEKNITPF